MSQITNKERIDKLQKMYDALRKTAEQYDRLEIAPVSIFVNDKRRAKALGKIHNAVADLRLAMDLIQMEIKELRAITK